MNEYNQKRDFAVTSEPEGKVEKSAKKLHFVVQHHLARREHYDLRLEWGGVLLSWAVPKGPSLNPNDKRLAVHVEDHPLAYRHFEGEIPKGQYGGGTVTIWDKGFWEPLKDSTDGMQKGILKFMLHGERLKGKWTLIRTDEKTWLLRKEKDEFANEGLFKNSFDKVSVQLAKLETILPKSKDWLFELKYDGYRIISFVEQGKARLVSRNGNDYTDTFKSIAVSLEQFFGVRAVVLDGEVVADNFKSIRHVNNHAYVVFDLLSLDGVDLRNQPLLARKQKLKELKLSGNLHYSEHTNKMSEYDFQILCDKNLEGVVAKKTNSIYSGTRNGDWIKIKNPRYLR